MSDLDETRNEPQPTADCCHDASTEKPPKGERKRFLTGGFLGGAIGGVCCAVGAVLVAFGLVGATVFGAFMTRYQPYFLVASAIFIGGWMYWMSRKVGFKSARLMLAKHGAIMAVVYLVTLMLAMGAAALAGVR